MRSMFNSDSFSEAYRPCFSVIMPCYNSEAYVRDAVNSILEQTYPHWELVAVNDGSTDATPEILREFAEKDARIRLCSKENGGYTSAVNAGLEKITGDYFLMMGSDDALDPELFARLRPFAGTDCIAFRTLLVKNGRTLGVEQVTDFHGTVSRDNTTLAEFSRDYPSHAEIFFTRDTSKCYKRSLLGQLQYWGRHGFDADGIFSMLLCHQARSFAAIPVDGYYWTLRADSLSGRKSFFAQDLERLEIWKQFYLLLAPLAPGEISQTEKEYLYYFLKIMETVWQASPGWENLTLVKQAAELICSTSSRLGYPLSLSAQSRLLLRSPVLWKLSAPLWRLAYRLLGRD